MMGPEKTWQAVLYGFAAERGWFHEISEVTENDTSGQDR
jgi:hypothetical protein